MTSICPARKAGRRPGQPAVKTSVFPPAQANTARAMSASAPMILLKSLLSRNAYGGDSGSTPILMVLPASDGYFCATLDGSHDCADAPCARRRAVTAHISSLMALGMVMANPVEVD